jgi:hypothetical protein
MTEFWKNYPAQNRDTPAIFYSRCFALIHAEMSKGLHSKACRYYCARQGVAFFDVWSITKFAWGSESNYGYKEATAQTVIREMFTAEMLVTERVRVVGWNPFYDTSALQKQVRLIMEQRRPPVIKTAAVIKKGTTRPGGKSSDGCRDPIHAPTDIATIEVIKIVKPVKGHPEIATILDTSSLQKLEHSVTDGQVPQLIAINPSPPPTQSLAFGDMAEFAGYSDKVQLFGLRDCPIVNGQMLEKPLSVRKYKIVAALLEKHPGGLLKTELDGVIGGEGGHKELRELAKTEPWCDVIIRPENNHSGGTRIL